MAGYVRGGWSSQLEVFLAPAENGTCLRAVLVVIGSNCRLYSGEVVRSIGGYVGGVSAPHVAGLGRPARARGRGVGDRFRQCFGEAVKPELN